MSLERRLRRGWVSLERRAAVAILYASVQQRVWLPPSMQMLLTATLHLCNDSTVSVNVRVW